MARTSRGPRPPSQAAMRPTPAVMTRRISRRAAARQKSNKRLLGASVYWKDSVRPIVNKVLKAKGFPKGARYPKGSALPSQIHNLHDEAHFIDRVERTPAKRGYKRAWTRNNANTDYRKFTHM